MTVRVLIVDDSSLFAEAIETMLRGDVGIEVIGCAANGSDAVDIVQREKPDLVLMDIHMPIMGGLEAVEIIMGRHPTPILVMTSADRGDRDKLALEAIRKGALDLIVKPVNYHGGTDHELCEKVKLLASVTVVRHQRRNLVKPPERQCRTSVRTEIVGLVGSTGAPAALATILGTLPASFHAPLLVVQHMVPGFVGSMVDWLNDLTPLTVEVARHDMQVRRGHVYVAPDESHLVLRTRTRIALAGDDPVGGNRPSGDRLLESMAEHYGAAAAAVILSGMGEDGRNGAKRIRDAGGVTLAQDEATSVVFGMPGAAWEAGVVDRIVPLGQIATELRGWTTSLPSSASAEDRL